MNLPKTNPLFSRIAAGAALFVALSYGSTLPAVAQVQEYEGFNYSGTVLDTQNGGTGWGSAWTNLDANATLSNDGVSLVFPASVTHVAQGSRITFAGAGVAERRLGTSISMAPEGSVYYFSALVKRQGAFNFSFGRESDGLSRWRMGATNSATGAAVLGISYDTVTANAFPTNETVFLLGRLVTHSSAQDQVSLNIYQAGDTVPSSEPTTWDATVNDSSGLVFTRFRVQNFDGLPLEIDELRVGTNYLAVAGPSASGPPVITTQPTSVTAYEGTIVQFTSAASGALPLSYQWRKDGLPLAGQTSVILRLTNVVPSQAGSYVLTATNSLGATNSNPAVLTVLAATNVNLGLQAMWHLDETTGLLASDATTNNNDGTLFNYAGDDSQWIASDYNGALDFNRAISNYVEVPNSASIGANLGNQFSVAAWFRPKANLLAAESTQRMLGKGNSFYLLQGTGASGGMNFLVKKGGASVTAGIGQTLLANQWYHIAGTYDGAGIRVYLDGILQTNVPVAAPIDITSLPLRFGSDYVSTNAGSRFDGAMDEVGVWERPLSQSEVLLLAGQAGPPTIVTQPQPAAAYAGGSATFTVRARGGQPLYYLWYQGTNELRSATSNTLSLANLQLTNAGNYYCTVSNSLGATSSVMATLTVTPVTNIADGLEAQYHFDESTGFAAADASGFGRTGQLVDFPDATSQWISGQVNGALNFDGSSNRVVVSNSAALNLGADATIAFWIYPTSYGSAQNVLGLYTRYVGNILRKGGYIDLQVTDDPGTVRATILANGVPAAQNSVQLNQWQHFTIVYQAGTVSFYKNGFRLGDPVSATLGNTNSNLMVLGNLDEGLVSSNYFAGGMDEVGIWERPLSESEILSLAGRDVTGPPVIVTQPQSLTRYVGGTAEFLVEATGLRPLTYQWKQNGFAVPNSNTNQLVLTNLSLGDAGSYVVTVQNGLNSATSAPPAMLTVLEITNVATGLVGYWTFDETNGTTFYDASGYSHDAALQNGTITPSTAGMVGGAFDFDGSSEFAIVPSAAELNLSDQASISVWVNPRSMNFTGGFGRIVRKDINFDFFLVTAGSTFELFGLNKAPFVAPANSVAINQWQHLAMVAKDGTIELFKNGRSVGPPVPGTLGPDNVNDLIIANFGSDLSIPRLFNGYMDELAIWNRALDSSEVDGIYQNGLVGRALNAPYEPFAIKSIDFPAANQVRLIFFSPYTTQPHGVQVKTNLTVGTWDDLTAATVTALGDGLMQAVFDKTAVSNAFYRIVAQPLPPIFVDDFESGAVGWTHGGAGDNWELGMPTGGPGQAYSGTNVYATGLSGNMNSYSDCYLRSPAINLTGVSRATLTFEEWRQVDPDSTFHGTIVSILDANSLAVLQQLSLAAGSTSGYQPRTLPLPLSVLGQNVIIEFRLYTDNYNLTGGWFIDDVKLLQE